MSRPAPAFPPTPDAESAFDCRATAALLRSASSVVWAAHLGALVAAATHAWYPLLAWALVLYFGVRVRLDAELLDLLAGDPAQAPGRLDAWLAHAGLRAGRGERSLALRCQGARRLARSMLAAFLGQCALTAVALWRA